MSAPAQPLQVDVRTASEMRGAGAAVVDVREAWEVEHCSIEGSIHIPLQTLPGRVDEIPVDRPVIITCHHGGRSMQAVQFLRSRGLEHVTNLEGGIDRWSQEVDPSVPRY